jgi:hypothetical protein
MFTVEPLEFVGGLALAGGDRSLEGGMELGEPGVGERDAASLSPTRPSAPPTW